jgi:hypothetical protein
MARGGVFTDWFEPRRFYRRGVPTAVHTALGLLPDMVLGVRGVVKQIRPRRALEIGPGDSPLLEGIPQPYYLDIAHAFCRPLAGRAVEGDVMHLPFREGAFDLVLAADLFTHIPPGDRWAALGEMARIAPRMVLFNPEPGTPEVQGSAVWTESLISALEARGFEIERRRFNARRRDGGPFPMDILQATRMGVEPSLPAF